MTDFVLKYRWHIIVLSILTGLVSLFFLPFIKTDPEIRNYIPQRMTSRIETDRIEDEFGAQDLILLLFTDSLILTPDNLTRIKEIDNSISELKGITRRISPFTMKSIKGEEGMMVAEDLIPEIPSDSSGIRILKEKILSNRFARDVVISSDMTSAAITAYIDPSFPERETLNRIDSVLGAHPGKAKVNKGGLPYIRKYIVSDVRKDAFILVPAALILMLVILKLSLYEWKSVMMPFSVVIISTMVTMALIQIAGWKMSLMTLLAPVILIAVANNYGIYLVARYQELMTENRDLPVRKLINELYHSLNVPVLFSGLTTIAGILGLLTHSVKAARQVGILAATGVTLALALSLIYIPALISVRRPFVPVKRGNESMKFINKILSNTAEKIISHSGMVIILSLIVIAVFSTGIFFVRTDTNQENFFPEKHPVKQASKIINTKFGGSQTISVMVSGDIKDPVIMRGIDSLTRSMEIQPGVGGVFSISQAVREMSKALYEKNEKEYDNIPESREAIAQFFELYNMSGNPDDFSQIINFNNTKAHILIRLNQPDNKTVNAALGRISDVGRTIPARIITGGYAVIMADFAGLIIRGQVSSLIFALLVIIVLLSVIFRSVKGGLTGSLPLLSSILILFGFMGITGIAIDPATALLSSIMIGVGVDFTIQFMWSVRLFHSKGFSLEDSLRKAYSTIGRSIIINAFSVMAGFSVLILSGFTSIRFFGYLIVISVGSCFIGAMIFIPAILMKYKPDFIKKKINNKTQER
jgi:predicted RND superfamily exporter protein